MASVLAQSNRDADVMTSDFGPRQHTLEYVGPTGTMFGIFYKNLVLTVLTLGIYRFWAKTRERRFLWANTHIDGEGFEYTGTGKELFLGFLKAVAILVPLFVGLQLIGLLFFGEGAERAVGAIQGFLIVILVYVGTFAARRYRMSRTTWRSIRMQQDGSAWRYAAIALKGVFLSIVTLGLYFPLMQTALARYETENLRFGTQQFLFTGRGRTMFKQFLVLWLSSIALIAAVIAVMASLQSSFDLKSMPSFSAGLSLITLAPIIAILAMSFHYQARFARFRADSTQLDGLAFSMPQLNGWRIFKLTAGNYLIIMFSLGLLMPLTTQRTMRFWVRHTQLEGHVDLDRIAQAERGPGTGEGLAGFFDIDVG
jgi:uncharacterized membrane protein YjgN (DUF898 family)